MMGTARKTKRKYTRRVKAGADTELSPNTVPKQVAPVMQPPMMLPPVMQQPQVIQQQQPVMQQPPVIQQQPVIQQPVIQQQEVAMPESEEKEPDFLPPRSLQYSRSSRKVKYDEDEIQDGVEDYAPISNNKLFYIACGVTVLGVLLLALGLYVLLRPPKYSGNIDAKITAASCQSGTNICTIDISYKVNESDYTQKDVSVKTLYSPDQSIAITYDPSNPNNYVIAAAKWIRPVVGGSLTILAFILVAVAWFYYNVHKN